MSLKKSIFHMYLIKFLFIVWRKYWFDRNLGRWIQIWVKWPIWSFLFIYLFYFDFLFFKKLILIIYFLKKIQDDLFISLKLMSLSIIKYRWLKVTAKQKIGRSNNINCFILHKIIISFFPNHPHKFCCTTYLSYNQLHNILFVFSFQLTKS